MSMISGLDRVFHRSGGALLFTLLLLIMPLVALAQTTDTTASPRARLDSIRGELTQIEAAWEGPLPDWLIAVRVHAIDNMIEDEIFEPWDEDDAESEAA